MSIPAWHELKKHARPNERFEEGNDSHHAVLVARWMSVEREKALAAPAEAPVETPTPKKGK